MELTAEQFSKLSKLIYKKLGLQFDEKKLYFLNKRVERRITDLGLKDADEYLFQLGYCDSNGDEMQALANLVTTNETYMFREFEQLAGFADVCLPKLIAAKQKTTDRRIRIWCAGCSSGEEAYTLAIIVREVFPDSRNWDVRITATDIDENMLELARNAVYGDRSVKNVPDVYSKHLLPTVTGFRIHPETARLVTDLSGWGVGMDVVRNSVEALRGGIHIQSEIGKGTSFRIELPASLLVSKAIRVAVSGHEVVLPIDTIRNMVKIPKSVVRTVQGQQIAPVRGTVFPLFPHPDCMRVITIRRAAGLVV